MHIRFTCPSCTRDVAISVYKVATSTTFECEHCKAEIDPITACEVRREDPPATRGAGRAVEPESYRW